MFERFTEQARRAIFFARYDASRYGSDHIEAEHLLLGLLREGYLLAKEFIPNIPSLHQIRSEIEAQIVQGKAITTSVEIPLTAQSKRVLDLAVAEASHSDQHHVGLSHILLALLQIEDGLAAKLLRASPETVIVLRQKLAEIPPGSTYHVNFDGVLAIEEFLGALKAGRLSDVSHYLSARTRFIDAAGQLFFGEEDFYLESESLLAPFAARRANWIIQESFQITNDGWIATVLWEDVPVPEKRSNDLLRMSIVLHEQDGVAYISLIQLTPVLKRAASMP